MLILTRGIGETVTIGHNIRIKILAIKGVQVRLGIEAPVSVKILREGLADSCRKKSMEEK